MPSHDGACLLDARGLQRSYGRVRVLRGLDLSLRRGEALAVLGPNGAGKTTLLKLLAGLIRPSAGNVHLLGQPLGPGAHQARRSIGFLSHQSLLYDDLTLLENLTFTARLYLMPRPRQAAWTALQHAGLAERAGELPRRLSRGLLQRAAIARALLHEPPVLLLDEPFTGLDATASERLRADLQARLSRGDGLVLATHNLADAWELVSRIVVLLNGISVVDEPRQGALDTFLPRYRELISA
jgi:heme exporter protein A